MAYDSFIEDHKRRNKEYQRRWYQQNKQKQIERTRFQKVKNRERNRSIALEYLKSGCQDCGEDDFVVLEFDHVRGKKLGSVGQMVSAPASEIRLREELDKCEVVCSNCHRRRTSQRCGGWWKSTLS